MLTATIVKVTTCTKYLPGRPKVDVIQLNYSGLAYWVSTDNVGKYEVGQQVAIEATGWYKNTGMPSSLRLIG